MLTEDVESAEIEDMLGFLLRRDTVEGEVSEGKMLCTCGGEGFGAGLLVAKGLEVLGPGLNLPSCTPLGLKGDGALGVKLAVTRGVGDACAVAGLRTLSCALPFIFAFALMGVSKDE